MKLEVFGFLAGLLSLAAMAGEYPASVDWAQRVTLSIPASGRAEQVLANPGERVKKGQWLLKLDRRRLDADVLAAQARVRQTEAELAEAKREMERTEELHAQTLIALHERETVKIALATAQARLDHARASLRAATADRADAQLAAPFDGLILSRQVEPGQFVNNRCATAPLFEIARADQRTARFPINADQWMKLQSASSAQVRVGGQTYPGQLVIPPLPNDAGEYVARVDFTPNAPLPAGLSATVLIAD